jgi:hypothetical protein
MEPDPWFFGLLDLDPVPDPGFIEGKRQFNVNNH